MEYCGATHGSTDYVYESETKDPAVLAAEVHEISSAIATRAGELARVASPA